MKSLMCTNILQYLTQFLLFQIISCSTNSIIDPRVKLEYVTNNTIYPKTSNTTTSTNKPEITSISQAPTTSGSHNPTTYNTIQIKDVKKLTLLKAMANKKNESITVAGQVPMKPQEKVGAVDCELPILPKESRLWRGNETHELNLPVTMPEDCALEEDCPPVIVSWEGTTDMQSGDILIVRIKDSSLIESPTQSTTLQRNAMDNSSTEVIRSHRVPAQPAVYQVTRQGHEHCDVTDGTLMDISPLSENDTKIITLYNKDLTVGINLLIVVSDDWGSQCVRLKVTVKLDNCGESQECSKKGVCYTNISMDGYECQCCPGSMGSHCEENDTYSYPLCLNKGIYVDVQQPVNADNYQCLCPFGYKGKHCEEVTICNSSPCQNGGTCVEARDNASFQCTCVNGWSGSYCERSNIGGACAAQPCINGICIEQTEANGKLVGSEEYRCFCQPGYAGTHCEYEYNECASSPCANGGTCTDRVGGFECSCGRGYTGHRCEFKVDLCSPNACPPHRFCIDRGNSYACECPRDFVGDECNIPARAACDNNPCAHGGTCWNGLDSFYCACRPGYTGKLCEEDFILESVMAGEESSSREKEMHLVGGAVREVRIPLGLYHDRLHNVYIAAGTLGAAIAIVGIVVTACHCRVNKTYAKLLSRMSRVTKPVPPRHWLQDKRTPAHARAAPPPPQPAPYPTAALDSGDMYYYIDFPDSQSSPLIQ